MKINNNLLGLVLAFAFSPGFLRAQSQTREIEPGLEYTHIKRAEGPQSIHVLKVKRGHKQWQWTTGLGDGRVYGLANVPAIAKASGNALNARPIAAINGDFFAIARGDYQGDPEGLQIVEGEVVSAPSKRSCVWFDATGQPQMAKVESKFRVTWPDGKTDTTFGLNGPRGDGEAVLFTPTMAWNPKDVTNYHFGTRTTDGRELLLEPQDDKVWHPFAVGKSYQAKIASIREGGNSTLTKKSVILSLGPKLVTMLPSMKVGDGLTLRFETTPDLSGARNAIGGGERLVADGKIVTDGKSKDWHPRTILAWNAEHIFLVVVDGRAPKVAIGMTYIELANLAKELFCTEALNLDGGGSSTLWADGKILNTPSDGVPRQVANALVLVEKK